MSRRIITTNSFNAVAAGQTATIDLPIGALLYHRILLAYGTSTGGGPTEANMEAEITEIRVKVNGKVQRVMSAAQLFDVNRVNGISVVAGFLPIFFSEPWRRSVQGEELLAWGTSDISTFQIEVDIDAGASAPTLEARLVVDDSDRPMGPIIKWRRHVVPVSAIGIVNVTTLPRQDAYLRLHAFSILIDDIEVTVDQLEIWNLTDAQAREIYAEEGLAVPAALTSVIFDHTQRVGDFLPMSIPLGGSRFRPVSEFRVDYNMNTATAFTLLTEIFGPRD